MYVPYIYAVIIPILLDCINENISPGVFTISACSKNMKNMKNMKNSKNSEDSENKIKGLKLVKYK